MRAHVARRAGSEGRARSRFSRFGVTSLVGGPDCSDEPAVEGLVISYESRLWVFLVAVDLFRVGTPSGHVHCRWNGGGQLEWPRASRYELTCLSLAMSAP